MPCPDRTPHTSGPSRPSANRHAIGTPATSGADSAGTVPALSRADVVASDVSCWAACSGDGARDLVQRLGVLERREVARIGAERRARGRRGARSSRCASSAARVTQTTRSGRNALPSASATARADLARQLLARSRVGPRHAEDPRHLALHLVRHADRRRLGDGRVRDRRGLQLCRPDPLARDVERVVASARAGTSSRPRRPTPSRRASTRRGSGASTSRGSARDRPRCRASSPATAACRPARRPRRAPGSPSASKTSMSCPSAGKPSEHSLIGSVTTTERKQAPTSVPPERLTIGMRPPPTRSSSQRYGAGFHGSPVVAIARSEERSAAGLALRHQRADERGRDAEHRHPLRLDRPPQPVVRPVGRALGVDDRRARWRRRRRPSTAP